MSTSDKLAKTYRNWCKRNYLPLMSADELLCGGAELTDSERTWLRSFIEKWGNTSPSF